MYPILSYAQKPTVFEAGSTPATGIPKFLNCCKIDLISENNYREAGCLTKGIFPDLHLYIFTRNILHGFF